MLHVESQRRAALAQSQAEAVEVPEDLTAVMDDPDFLQRVLSDLPGVDPSSDVIQSVIQSTRQQKEEREKKKNDK